MRRAWGISFGLAAQALFALTVWHLFWFLKGHPPADHQGWLACDVLLAGQFAAAHSALLYPPVRRRLERWTGASFYGCFFCVATCLGLLAMFALWQPGSLVLWQLSGWARGMMLGLFGLSWVALLYSLNLTGLGYQTGWTPWWQWLRGRPPARRTFRPRGAYLLLRHPVYLSFLGLTWFTPDMTVDRALLCGVWTVYIFFGSYLKDRRLLYYAPQEYAAYQSRVPGYPLMPAGPLARVQQPA